MCLNGHLNQLLSWFQWNKNRIRYLCNSQFFSGPTILFIHITFKCIPIENVWIRKIRIHITPYQLPTIQITKTLLSWNRFKIGTIYDTYSLNSTNYRHAIKINYFWSCEQRGLILSHLKPNNKHNLFTKLPIILFLNNNFQIAPTDLLGWFSHLLWTKGRPRNHHAGWSLCLCIGHCFLNGLHLGHLSPVHILHKECSV